MNKLAQNVIHAQSRTLTLGLVLVLSLLSLTASAQNTVSRTNASGTVSGTDVATVQTATGAANGDTLIITGNATHNSTVSLTPTYNTFTVRSNGSDKQTINGSANPFYDISGNGSYTFNLNNLSYNGNSGNISFLRQSNSSTETITINADNVSFEEFKLRTIYNQYGNLNFSGATSQSAISFSNNSAGDYGGGAIYADNMLQFSNGSYTFKKNSGYYAGAIDCNGIVTFSSDATAKFIENSSSTYGAAIDAEDGVQFLGGSYTFEKNSAGTNGGAIKCDGTVTFSGNSTANFTGNMANSSGNDIFTHKLSFTDNGTYSFDGGMNIVTEASIDKAQVNIAGRQYRPDDPTTEDETNEYLLNKVTISNGGKLNADLDYTNYIRGNFTLNGSESMITQSKGADSATIKSKSGNGVMDLTYEAKGGVSKESIFISSGRIDITGCMEATIEVKRDAAFSTGTVGRLETTGDFVAVAGALLIFEQGANSYDQLIADDVTINNDTNFDLTRFTSFPPGSYYDIIIANGTLNVDLAWVEKIKDFITPYNGTALIHNVNTVRLLSLLDPIDPNEVPEPSTWALLILGAAGLAYMRKRSRQ
ncbi:MAG: PEP-CTERM sorting domain-containing protein [Thermoguttaceae bacterium]|nr:PEP-CTERM sorting domain-containing protein [Thermoguttaceae bacterium]